jgi:hypothetical protein
MEGVVLSRDVIISAIFQLTSIWAVSHLTTRPNIQLPRFLDAITMALKFLSCLPGPLPNRALDVRGDKVRLCDTAGQFGDYCALSHGWGPPKETLRTTDSNIGNMMSGIELQSFPRLL